MKVLSVVLATFNGQAFLLSQLESLSEQTCSPDELIISDDGSSDDTADIVCNFALTAKFGVSFYKAVTHLGITSNFEKAITHSSGLYIALSDQDDVWLPSKLQVLSSVLKSDSKAVAAFGNASVVSEDLEPLGYTEWERLGFDAAKRQLMYDDKPWTVLIKESVVTGATLVFRRELLPHILPIPVCWNHDAWIALIASSLGKLVPVNDVLMLYRQHDGNAIGGKRAPLFAQFRRANKLGRVGYLNREIDRFTVLRDRLLTLEATPRRDVVLKLVEGKIYHLQVRMHLPSNRLFRVPLVFGQFVTGNYRRFAKNWLSLVADLFMS